VSINAPRIRWSIDSLSAAPARPRDALSILLPQRNAEYTANRIAKLSKELQRRVGIGNLSVSAQHGLVNGVMHLADALSERFLNITSGDIPYVQSPYGWLKDIFFNRGFDSLPAKAGFALNQVWQLDKEDPYSQIIKNFSRVMPLNKIDAFKLRTDSVELQEHSEDFRRAIVRAGLNLADVVLAVEINPNDTSIGYVDRLRRIQQDTNMIIQPSIDPAHIYGSSIRHGGTLGPDAAVMDHLDRLQMAGLVEEVTTLEINPVAIDGTPHASWNDNVIDYPAVGYRLARNIQRPENTIAGSTVPAAMDAIIEIDPRKFEEFADYSTGQLEEYIAPIHWALHEV